MVSGARAEAFFLKAFEGERFCLFHRPEHKEVGASLLFIHPFAEEMNKSRRMIAQQARALAAAGCAVLQIDLHGCGDSSGDFGDATWESWLEDVELASGWLKANSSGAFWLWGLRAGCLVVSDAASRIGDPVNCLYWQPILSGKQCLQQFLRLKTAGGLLGGEGKAAGGVGTEAFRRQLDEGKTVEVAGYRLSPGMAAGLDRVELGPPNKSSRVEWLEIAAKQDATLMPASQRRIEQWLSAGHRVQGGAVSGPSFWMTTEIAESSHLIQATLSALGLSSESAI